VQDPQARAALDALAQNIKVAMDTFATKADLSTPSTSPAVGGASSFGTGTNGITNNVLLGGGVFTQKNLIQDLANGTVSIVSGGLSSANVMKLGSNYVVFQNSLANPLGSTGAYTGTVRTALGLFSTGIVGGYNDPTTGNWVSSITIDTATGNLNVLGTIKANSIIQVGAYLGTDTVSTVLGNISTANSNANTALANAATAISTANTAISNAASKLSKSAADVLSGTINFSGAGGFATGSISVNGSGVASGSGVAITSKGIVGLNSGTPTFSINATTGAASFSGDITGSNGTFTGTLSAVGGTFTGTLSSVNGTFTGSLVAATGTFAGTVSAGNFVTSGGTIGTQYGTNAWIAGTSGPGYSAGDSWFGGTMTIGGKLIVNGAFTTGGVNVGQYIATPATSMALYAQNTGSGSAAAFYNTTTGTFGSPTLLVQQGGTGPVLKAINPYAGGIGSLFSTNQNYAFVAARLNDSAPVAWFQGAIALSLTDSIGTAWQLSNPSSSINAAGGGYYLAGDGAWHSVSSLGGGTVTSVSGAGTVSGLTLTGTVTSTGNLTLGGTLALTAAQITSGLGLGTNGVVYWNGSTISTEQTLTTFMGTNSGTATASSFTMNMVATSSATGLTLNTTGAGSTVTASLSGNVVNTLNGLKSDVTLTSSFPGVGITSSGTNINIYQISDASLKTNVKPIDLGLEFVRNLKPVTYNWNTNLMTFDKPMYGFIADDVIVATNGKESNIVYTHEDTEGPLKNIKAVGTDGIVAALTKAVQELDAKVTLLESKNA
jgi:hypothetical protein